MVSSRFYFIAPTLALLAAGSLMGCSTENSNDVAIAAAQTCLDKAQSASDADACQAQVQGMTSTQAYEIRCSANLIAQGFTGSRIASAYQQMKNPPAGSNATATMLSYFVFNQNLPLDTPAVTNTNCSASGDASLAGIGSLVNTASIIASFAITGSTTGSIAGTSLDPTSANFNPAQLQSAVTTAYQADSPTVNTAVGQLAVSAAASYCGTGSAVSSQSVCTVLTQAVSTGNGDLANTGYSLLNQLQSL